MQVILAIYTLPNAVYIVRFFVDEMYRMWRGQLNPLVGVCLPPQLRVNQQSLEKTARSDMAISRV